jgi:hypothetical protein
MSKKKRMGRKTFQCPNCGAEVPTGRIACPECGSDEETGWSENANVWGLDLPNGHGEDDEFDYEEFVAREFEGKPKKIIGLPIWLLYIIVFGVIVGLLLWAL